VVCPVAHLRLLRFTQQEPDAVDRRCSTGYAGSIINTRNDMKPFAYSTLLIALLIAVLAAIFTVQNDAAVTVYFFRWQADSTTAIVVLGAFAAGVAASSFALLPTVLRAIGNVSVSRKEAQRLARELQQKEAERKDSENTSNGAPPLSVGR